MSVLGSFLYFDLLCWTGPGPFSTRCALMSTEAQVLGAGFCIGGGTASLETPLLLEEAND